jgi:cysteine synthase
MMDRSTYYVLVAFIAGVTLTSIYQEQKTQNTRSDDTKKQNELNTEISNAKHLDSVKTILKGGGTSLGLGTGSIREGIEGCIGQTPLIKIKSLSEFTGCEILAKAEVGRLDCMCGTFHGLTRCSF